MLLFWLAVIVTPAWAAKDRFFEETFGSVAQPGFAKPEGMIVAQGSGDILVIDADAKAIRRFKPDGQPDPFPSLGTNLIDGSETPQGDFAFGSSAEVQLAIDESAGPTDGDIYITQSSSHLVDIFSPGGEYIGQLTKFGSADLGEVCGVTVDSDGVVYISDYSNNQIHEYVPSGSPASNTDNAKNFNSVTHPCTLAAGAGPSAGYLFVDEYHDSAVANEGRTFKLNSATGGLEYEVGKDHRTVTVDPDTGHLLVATDEGVTEYDVAGEKPVAIISSIGPNSPADGVAVRAGSSLYIAHAGEPHVEVYGPLAEIEPRIEGEWVVGATDTEGSLGVEVGPAEEDTSYHVEYGESLAYGQRTPEREVGKQSSLSIELTGLAPATTYHWRLVATDPVGTTVGPDRVLRTHGTPAPSTACPNQIWRLGASRQLPDCRAYEMVSPVDKNGGDIDAYGYEGINAEFLFPGLDQSASDGGKLAFTAATAFAGAEGAPFVSEYVSERDAKGWTTESIDPPERGGISNESDLSSQYKAFSPSLRYGWLAPETGLPLLDPGPLEGYRNLYRREIGAATYEWLHSSGDEPTPEPCVEPQTVNHCYLFPELQGASADGRHAVFRVNDALTPEAPHGIEAGVGGVEKQTIWQLYLWSQGEGDRLVSIRPNGEPITESSTAGTENHFGALEGHWGSLDTVEHSMSADGRFVYWSAPVFGEPGPGQIYLRVNADKAQSSLSGGKCTEPEKACTVVVSQPLNTAQFWTANPQGTKAIFSDVHGPLEGKLYVYEFDQETGEGSRSQIASELLGVLGASEDLDYVYFASRADLAEGAVGGEPNLYLDHDGAITFLGELADEDISEPTNISLGAPSPVNPAPREHIARVSPDGRHLAFVSASPVLAQQVAGYDNTDAASGNPDREVYSYGVGEGLHCVSCNPTGARPRGFGFTVGTGLGHIEPWAAAWIPGYQAQLYGRRPLSDDGTRLFFNSVDPLSLRDVNDAQDVYEWEAPGAGDCTTSKPSYSSQDGGCINLISSGQSPRDSEFVDASASGADVFIRTESSLLPQDPGSVDIYDARVDGGFPEAEEATPCEGDSCQSAPPAPGFEQPASRGYRGPGDPSLAHLNCTAFGHRAGKLAHHAKRLRRASRRAARAGKARQARTINRRSVRLARHARKVSKHARRCRRANRRAVR